MHTALSIKVGRCPDWANVERRVRPMYRAVKDSTQHPMTFGVGGVFVCSVLQDIHEHRRLPPPRNDETKQPAYLNRREKT